MEDQITEDTIRQLVDQFYVKVRKDEDLGPVFLQAIGEDLEDWQPHLHKMYDFWSSIMLASGRYHGNPMQKHIALPSFDRALFDRWLELFTETALEIHPEEVAAPYLEKSRRIAESLKLGLYYRP
jgi:hemoglobin